MPASSATSPRVVPDKPFRPMTLIAASMICCSRMRAISFRPAGSALLALFRFIFYMLRSRIFTGLPAVSVARWPERRWFAHIIRQLLDRRTQGPILLRFALVIVGIFLWACAHAGADPDECRTVRIADAGYSDNVAQNGLLEAALSMRGYSN